MSAARFLLLSAFFLAGCRTVHDVAVTSFHVIDAPAKYVRDHVDGSETTTTTTTTSTVSDVTTPGRPVSSPPPKTVHHETATPRPQREVASSAPQKSPSPSPRPVATTVQFPTAKPVPGKPGYVYSVDPKGGIVDVTGYKSGDKAKDPYTKQIFIVP